MPVGAARTSNLATYTSRLLVTCLAHAPLWCRPRPAPLTPPAAHRTVPAQAPLTRAGQLAWLARPPPAAAGTLVLRGFAVERAPQLGSHVATVRRALRGSLRGRAPRRRTLSAAMGRAKRGRSGGEPSAPSPAVGFTLAFLELPYLDPAFAASVARIAEPPQCAVHYERPSRHAHPRLPRLRALAALPCPPDRHGPRQARPRRRHRPSASRSRSSGRPPSILPLQQAWSASQSCRRPQHITCGHRGQLPSPSATSQSTVPACIGFGNIAACRAPRPGGARRCHRAVRSGGPEMAPDRAARARPAASPIGAS